MDVLSEVLQAVRLSGAMLFRGEFSSPWSCSASDSRMAAPFLVPGAKSLVFFHVVTEGRCWAEVENQEPLMLEAGDVIALPYGDAHSMGNPQGETRTPISSLLPPPPWPELPTVSFGGGGEPTRILCGFLYCDDALFNPVLTHLPRVLCVRARRESSWLETSSRYMLEEASRNRPGGASILGRLAELLFVEVLRRHMEELGENATGWLAAVKDPTVGKALQLMHGDLARPWTIEGLGHCVGLSRSALADRFRHLLGEPPMRYLTRWRVQVAAQLLRDTDDGIAAIGARVGYESEAAFNRAFKRHAGEPPATWRNGARAQGHLSR
jgi:AraC family transcriptional regulator, alkane utilization regulator